MKEVVRIYGSVVITAGVFGAVFLLLAGITFGKAGGNTGILERFLTRALPENGEPVYGAFDASLEEENFCFEIVQDSLLCGQTYHPEELFSAVTGQNTVYVISFEEILDDQGERTTEEQVEFTEDTINFEIAGVYQCLIRIGDKEEYYLVPLLVNQKA